ncbi:T9SS type A sorting domain-containing protein [Taibaiella lutea]|uniref:T9SS type A sorting domain-containing protein n=1 Tax=Taibaiella lutea TaxID=2608001 RepID=A0A5M6CQC1_9BACT|nr:T9SS type A sorting domain-containing protein [Taibaiella lutea]KAA5536172.1 T9SS type A sorting domain-containing protein [Taibaiella lutea]
MLFDDFNGTQLDHNKWIDHFSSDGMPDGDNDLHWADAHITGQHALCSSDNVVVSNGTCKLLVKNEPISWHCSTCPLPLRPKDSKYLSSGTICTPYHLKPDEHNNFFNSGRFEVKMKQPNFPHAHTCVWTWFGNTTWTGTYWGADEIDITESNGKGNSSLYPDLEDYATNMFYRDMNYGQNHYFLHGWGPPAGTLPNPYHIEEDNHRNYSQPGQQYWNSLTHTYIDITAWHTYACEWDTASIKIYYDNALLNTIWKYYKNRNFSKFWIDLGGLHYNSYTTQVGSGCNATGIYKITYGYPYNSNSSECNFRIISDADIDYPQTNTSTLLGQSEIDYVKIWQKHPENDGHVNQCPDNSYPHPIIDGPSEVCPIGSYILSPSTTGTWSSFDDNILYLINQSSSGCTVSKQAGDQFTQGWVGFSYGNGNPACPLKTVYRSGLYCHESTNWDIVMPYVLDNNGNGYFQLISELYNKRDISGGTTPVVSWNIAINSGQDFYDESTALNYTVYGQYASTPSFSMKESESYNLKWTMNVTDASGTWSRSGERNSKTPLMQQEDDNHTYYLNAYIDDKDYYDEAIHIGVAGSMVSEEEFDDTLYMNEMVEKIKASNLQPYLITDGCDEFVSKKATGFDKSAEENRKPHYKSNTKIYPNPVQSDITIIAGSGFKDGQNVNLNIYDLLGRCVHSDILTYRKGNIMKAHISEIPHGNYILELKQGSIEDHVKLTKANE